MNRIIIILLSIIILESIFIGFVLFQYNKGFFIKYYFNKANGSTKIVYKQGNIKLWEDLTPPLLNDKADKWVTVHTGGTITAEYDAKSYIYWKSLKICAFYMSPSKSIEIKKKIPWIIGEESQRSIFIR